MDGEGGIVVGDTTVIVGENQVTSGQKRDIHPDTVMKNDDKSDLEQPSSPLLSPTTPHDEALRTSTLKDNDRGT